MGRMSGADAQEGDYVESLLPVTNAHLNPKFNAKVISWTLFYLICSSSM
jgi:hypothetical protein